MLRGRASYPQPLVGLTIDARPLPRIRTRANKMTAGAYSLDLALTVLPSVRQRWTVIHLRLEFEAELPSAITAPTSLSKYDPALYTRRDSLVWGFPNPLGNLPWGHNDFPQGRSA